MKNPVFLFLDAAGVFRTEAGTECLRIPQPAKGGVAQCIVVTLDGKRWPFSDVATLRECLEHQANLPERVFPKGDVGALLQWATTTSDSYRKELDRGPRPRARRESERWRENADWMGTPYG